MTEREKFIVKLRELAADAPNTIITMPVNPNGWPEGCFDPHTFFNYIANCMEADFIRSLKGVRRD